MALFYFEDAVAVVRAQWDKKDVANRSKQVLILYIFEVKESFY